MRLLVDRTELRSAIQFAMEGHSAKAPHAALQNMSLRVDGSFLALRCTNLEVDAEARVAVSIEDESGASSALLPPGRLLEVAGVMSRDIEITLLDGLVVVSSDAGSSELKSPAGESWKLPEVATEAPLWSVDVCGDHLVAAWKAASHLPPTTRPSGSSVYLIVAESTLRLLAVDGNQRFVTQDMPLASESAFSGFAQIGTLGFVTRVDSEDLVLISVARRTVTFTRGLHRIIVLRKESTVTEDYLARLCGYPTGREDGAEVTCTPKDLLACAEVVSAAAVGDSNGIVRVRVTANRAGLALERRFNDEEAHSSLPAASSLSGAQEVSVTVQAPFLLSALKATVPAGNCVVILAGNGRWLAIEHENGHELIAGMVI